MNNFLKIGLIVAGIIAIAIVGWSLINNSQDKLPQENTISEQNNSENKETTSETDSSESKTIEVNIEGFAFNPKEIEISVGDTITWTNLDSVRHTATSDNGVFDSGLLSNGESWSYTFSEAGTYDYHCTPHPSMKGTIIVN